jgi:hypothetical protein
MGRQAQFPRELQGALPQQIHFGQSVHLSQLRRAELILIGAAFREEICCATEFGGTRTGRGAGKSLERELLRAHILLKAEAAGRALRLDCAGKCGAIPRVVDGIRELRLGADSHHCRVLSFNC